MQRKAAAAGGAADQENVAPRPPHPSAGGALGATPVPEARPLGPGEAPISRSITDMWALLQSGKPVVEEVGVSSPEHAQQACRTLLASSTAWLMLAQLRLTWQTVSLHYIIGQQRFAEETHW